MNEQLQQALTAILNKTMSGIDAGVNFLSAEIPDVIHQLLLWKLLHNSVLALIGVCVLVLAWALTQKTLDNYATESAKGWGSQRNERYIFPAFLLVIALPLGSTLAIGKGLQALQIWIAPKIYLIEYAASFAK